jgi:hypothetical protein
MPTSEDCSYYGTTVRHGAQAARKGEFGSWQAAARAVFAGTTTLPRSKARWNVTLALVWSPTGSSLGPGDAASGIAQSRRARCYAVHSFATTYFRVDLPPQLGGGRTYDSLPIRD